jgi:hypothetical protein
MKFFLSVMFVSLLAFASDVVAMIDPIWEVVAPIIIDFGQNYPIILSIVVIMGGARLIFKPVISGIRAYVTWTKTKSDDIILDKIEKSIPFKVLEYLLDWAFSVKTVK